MANWEDVRTTLMNVTGATNVYYQPPPTLKMQYPCIIFEKSDEQFKHADNSVFNRMIEYQAKVVYSDPDCPIIEQMSKVRYCRFDRHYKADGMYHDVYSLYFN